MRCLTALIALYLLWGCATLPEEYISLSSGETYGIERVLHEIEGVKVIFVGEAHDDRDDHLVQLTVLRYLNGRGKRPVVAMEVFPADRQAVLDAWLRGRMDNWTFEIACAGIWDMLTSYYGDILSYAKENGLNLHGLAADRSYVLGLARNGLQTLPAETRKELILTDCADDPEYSAVMESMADRAAHKGVLPFFCDSQRYADAFMAHKIASLVREGSRSQVVVVFLGAAHAARFAVPAALQRHVEAGYRILLPGSFENLTGAGIDEKTADYVWY